MRGQWSRSTSRRTSRKGAPWKGATQNRRRASAVLASLALAVAGLLALQPPAAQSAPTDLLTLTVTSARTEPRAFGGAGVTEGDAVDTYKFLINRGQHRRHRPAHRHRAPARPTRRRDYPELMPLDLDQRGAPDAAADRHPGRPGRPRRRAATCPTAST